MSIIKFMLFQSINITESHMSWCPTAVVCIRLYSNSLRELELLLEENWLHPVWKNNTWQSGKQSQKCTCPRYAGMPQLSDLPDLLTFLMLETNILALGDNTMPADALAPKVAICRHGTACVEYANMYCCSRVNFIYFWSSKIQDMIQNLKISFLIYKAIQHVKN